MTCDKQGDLDEEKIEIVISDHVCGRSQVGVEKTV